MPEIQGKKGSIIVRDSSGNLIKLLPSTISSAVKYGDTTAEELLNEIEDNDVESVFVEVENNEEEDIHSELQNIKGIIPASIYTSSALYGALLYDTDSEEGFDFYNPDVLMNFRADVVSSNTPFETTFQIDPSKTIVGFAFYASGMNCVFDGANHLNRTHVFCLYGQHSDISDNSPHESLIDDEDFEHYSVIDFIRISFPAQGQTSSWTLNYTMVFTSRGVPIDGYEIDNFPAMTISIENIDGINCKASFYWNWKEEVTVDDSKTWKTLKTSIVRHGGETEEESTVISGLLQNVDCSYTSTLGPYEIEVNSYYKPYILIGDANGSTAWVEPEESPEESPEEPINGPE